MIKLTLKLTRPAKSRGGDRYEAMLEEEDKPLVIYLPQSITRKFSGQPMEEFEMALEPKGTYTDFSKGK